MEAISSKNSKENSVEFSLLSSNGSLPIYPSKYIIRKTIIDSKVFNCSSFIENFKSNPTPEQSKMKESILQCIRKGSYPHLGPMIAMGGSCLLATLGFVLAAFTFGFSAPLATIGLGGCVGSTAMGTGDFWKGVESEVAQIKKCVGA